MILSHAPVNIGSRLAAQPISFKLHMMLDTMKSRVLHHFELPRLSVKVTGLREAESRAGILLYSDLN